MKNRNRNLLSYSIDSICRYKIRTFVILISIALCITLFASVFFLKDGLAKDEQLSLKYAPDITVQGIVNGRPST